MLCAGSVEMFIIKSLGDTSKDTLNSQTVTLERIFLPEKQQVKSVVDKCLLQENVYHHLIHWNIPL